MESSRTRIIAIAASAGLMLGLMACGSDEEEGAAVSEAQPEEPMAVFDIAGHSHRLPIRCFVSDRQMAISPADADGEEYDLPEGMSSLSLSGDFTAERNQIVVMAMSDSDDPRHYYHWVVRDGDNALGEFNALEIDREAGSVRAEAVFHNQAYDSDDSLFGRGEEQPGTVTISC